MSAIRRLASGNLAGLVSVATNLVVQIALVPVFLHHWSVAHYGLWLALTTAVTMLAIVDTAHLDFLGFECLKLPSADRDARSQILSDTLPVIPIVAVIELGLLVLALISPAAPRLLGLDAGAPAYATICRALIGLMLLWYLVQFPIQLLGRGIASIGHYAMTAWWYCANAIAQAVAVGVAVMLDADLGGAALAFGLGTLAAQGATGLHYAIVARRERLGLRRPVTGDGLRRLGRALMLGASSLLEFMQQAGFRLVLLPFLGAGRLVQFATMRTVANVVQQGLIMLVNPAIPELMRYVSDRDAVRARIVMTGMYAVSLIVMCPGFVVLQAIVRPLYAAWTGGKVAFDPASFVALSAAVLIAGLAQASRAIARGNNLVTGQAVASLVAGVALIGLTFVLAPRIGLLGAALGVVAAELLRAGVFTAMAMRWIGAAGFDHPTRPAAVAIGGVAATIGVLCAMAALPGREVVIVAAYVPLWSVALAAFWRATSPEERALLGGVVATLRRGAARAEGA